MDTGKRYVLEDKSRFHSKCLFNPILYYEYRYKSEEAVEARRCVSCEV
jgi:hypothetical protein